MKRIAQLAVILFLAIVVTACSNTDDTDKDKDVKQEEGWELSPSFTLGEYDVRGVEGKLAILDLPFVAKEIKNYTIFIWGKENTPITGPVRIEAVHEATGDVEKAVVLNAGTEDEEKVWESPVPMISGNRAFTSIDMSLPYEGIWRLDVYLDGDKFGELFVEVEKN
ncbi:DUF4871 domain-containing protein [Bacillaceae bacterium W0354]